LTTLLFFFKDRSLYYSTFAIREQAPKGQQWDYYSTMKTAQDKGRAEGRAEGEQSKAQEIATRLKTMGMSPEEIAKVTGLTQEEINRL
jgi:predicted transposase/invertase (TIGR01784 family)